ncbi:hypothetical protein SKAU_G00115980 [Synaphobranchus kaupii]|uniref:Uncharacterized protein n=1 Tax=Synaphobranchus kaupii TaxID=118154 RepID=A0A9Q1FMQ7_SYNKA|nr:hypothetical protein SKAU_G00115980 [Synaphobranchus kaupii]
MSEVWSLKFSFRDPSARGGKSPLEVMTELDHHESFADFQRRFLPPVFGVEFCVALAGNAGALWLMGGTGTAATGASAPAACTDRALPVHLQPVQQRLLRHVHQRQPLRGHRAPLLRPEPRAPQTRHRRQPPGCGWLVVAVSSPVLRFAGRVPEGTARWSACRRAGSARTSARTSPTACFLAVFGCLLPLLATAASYGAIFRTVWRNGKHHTGGRRGRSGCWWARVLTLYAVSFVPYHALRNYHLYLKIEERYEPRVNEAYQVSKGVGDAQHVPAPLALHGPNQQHQDPLLRGAGGWGRPIPWGAEVAPNPKPIRDPTIQSVRKTGGQK